jgi:hypothetical protein
MESDDPEPSSLWTRIKDKFSLKKTYHHVKNLAKKHGWKIGAIAIAFELFEHFVLPAVLIAVTGQPHLAIAGTLPIGECIFYPVLFKIIGGSA